MSILILTRRNIVDQIPDWLAQAGQPLILFTTKSSLNESFWATSAHRYAKVFLVEDYESDSATATLEEAARSHKVKRIVSCAEADVLRTAELRELLRIPGQSVDSARAYRDKFVMKTILHEAGIAVARMISPLDRAELESFANAVGYPIALKPRLGAGSKGVRILKSSVAVEEEPERWSTPMLAEEWVNGDFLSVDGLMRSGRVVQAWPSFTTANLNAVSGKSLLRSRLLTATDPLRTDVERFVGEVIAALPAVDELTAFHAEVFWKPDGSLCLNEIACRPGGCGHVPVYERAFGVNLYAESLRGQAGIERELQQLVDLQQRTAAYIWFTPREGKIVNMPSTCPLPDVALYRPTMNNGDMSSGAHAVSDHVAQAFIEGGPNEVLDDRLNAIEAWWHAQRVWG